MYKILDSHSHIYPTKIALKASNATGGFYDAKMKHDGTVETLLAEEEKAGITHFLVHSIATSPKQVSSINRFISDTVKNSNGKMTGFGSMHPESNDLEADFSELISLGLKGVKLHPDIQGYKTDDVRMMKIYECCEKNNLILLLHCGDKRYDFSNPNRIKPVLDTFTDLTVIGAHFGGYTIWKEATKELAGYKNLYVDTSSSMFALQSDEAEELIKLYGEDRVLFGVDYPMWNPKEEVERFMKIDLSEEARRKILWENGAKLLKIED